MDKAVDQIVIELTREEAVELFMRCLRSHEDDSETSMSVLRQLASKLKCESACFEFESMAAVAA